MAEIPQYKPEVNNPNIPMSEEEFVSAKKADVESSPAALERFKRSLKEKIAILLVSVFVPGGGIVELATDRFFDRQKLLSPAISSHAEDTKPPLPEGISLPSSEVTLPDQEAATQTPEDANSPEDENYQTQEDEETPEEYDQNADVDYALELLGFTSPEATVMGDNTLLELTQNFLIEHADANNEEEKNSLVDNYLKRIQDTIDHAADDRKKQVENNSTLPPIFKESLFLDIEYQQRRLTKIFQEELNSFRVTDDETSDQNTLLEKFANIIQKYNHFAKEIFENYPVDEEQTQEYLTILDQDFQNSNYNTLVSDAHYYYTISPDRHPLIPRLKQFGNFRLSHRGLESHYQDIDDSMSPKERQDAENKNELLAEEINQARQDYFNKIRGTTTEPFMNIIATAGQEQYSDEDLTKEFQAMEATRLAIEDLEQKAPGSVQYLNEHFGLTIFSRYPQELLIKQYQLFQAIDGGQKPNLKSYLLVLNGLEDHNSAFDVSEVKDQYRNVDQLGDEHYIIFTEMDSLLTFNKNLNKVTTTLGVPNVIMIGGHGSKESISLSQNLSSTRISNETLLKELLLEKNHIQKGGSVILNSCSTGDITTSNFASLLSRQRPDLDIYAANTPTETPDLNPTINPDTNQIIINPTHRQLGQEVLIRYHNGESHYGQTPLPPVPELETGSESQRLVRGVELLLNYSGDINNANPEDRTHIEQKLPYFDFNLTQISDLNQQEQEQIIDHYLYSGEVQNTSTAIDFLASIYPILNNLSPEVRADLYQNFIYHEYKNENFLSLLPIFAEKLEGDLQTSSQILQDLLENHLQDQKLTPELRQSLQSLSYDEQGVFLSYLEDESLKTTVINYLEQPDNTDYADTDHVDSNAISRNEFKNKLLSFAS
jgi:hypothetical protein